MTVDPQPKKPKKPSKPQPPQDERGPFKENLDGQVPGKCNARKRGSSGYCGQTAGWGTDHAGIGHCKLHGGNTIGQRTKADRDRLDMEVHTLLDREGLKPMTNPLEQLQLLASEVVQYKNILGSKVEEIRTWSYDDISDKEDLRAVILAFERAMDRCNAVLSGLVKLNIEERLVRLSEAQASLLIEIVVAVLDSRELGLTKEGRMTGRSILAREVSSRSTTPVQVTA